jgi:hypothetical protein
MALFSRGEPDKPVELKDEVTLQPVTLVRLRRFCWAIVQLLDKEIARYRPLCRNCFGSKGLVKTCECGAKR